MLASRIFPPEAAAASFRLGAVVEALARRHTEVEVLTAKAPPGHTWSDGAVRVRRWPVLRDSAGYVRGYLPYLSFDAPLVLRLLTTRRPDVVLVEPPPTTGAVVRAVTGLRSLRRRLPYVYYAADVWSDASAATGAPAPVVGLLRTLERFALRGAREVVAVSDGVAGRVRELGADPVHVIPNGIDTSVFRPQPGEEGALADPRGPAAQEAPFLLYAGTASEWQGAEIFAEAMAQVVREVPGARLVFLGQGSSWPRLRQLAAGLPEGTIELRPLAPPPVAAAWHRAATAALVSVKPGVDYDFAYPTKVLAALACGTPVVYAGPGPAAQDLAREQLGEAVSYGVSAVAGAMVRVLRTPADEAARQRRVSWVAAHRSLTGTGERVADVVAAVAHG